tara:strand:- start:32231 stop:33796 length:1566 start_codon:yes stop_codon:yes gene_type:complete
MGKTTGFLDYNRKVVPYRDPKKRINDFNEIFTDSPVEHLKEQSARCMDCGVPFCQSSSGCPIDNLIPEWNDLVYQGRWKEALDRLHKTNNFPEFTGRTCPAPCEGSCVLGITDPPVTIKNIENAIIDKGFEKGWIKPQPPSFRTGKKIAIVGSGPSGLAAAAQLNKVGHKVTVYERADRIGGLLMYGIPNMKLDKKVVERRVEILKKEGVEFITCTHIGEKENFDINHINNIMEQNGCKLSYIDPKILLNENDALLMATGATIPFDPTSNNPGRNLNGIHFAMDFLTKNTKSLLDSNFKNESFIQVKDKNVIVIGGGDTGADCIGTSLRHGCKSVVNFELLDRPPFERASSNPWPEWPRVYKLDYSHQEHKEQKGSDPRHYHIMTKEFVGDNNGNIKFVRTVELDWSKPTPNGPPWSEVKNSIKEWPVDLVLLATGFTGPEQKIADMLNVKMQNPRGNWKTFIGNHGEFTTNIEKVFVAGDCRRGQSLVVWAINEGRGAARSIDEYLMGETSLPAPGISQG